MVIFKMLNIDRNFQTKYKNEHHKYLLNPAVHRLSKAICFEFMQLCQIVNFM